MLKDEHPELAKYWNYKRNDEIGIHFEDASSGSGRKAWWKCDKGHEWEAIIRNVARGTRCPYCSGRKAIAGVNDLITSNPSLAKTWDYAKNSGLSPKDLTAGSGKIVWWKCNKGHSYRCAIYDANKGHSCPYCHGYKALTGYNDLATKYPSLAKEWDYEKNSTLNVTPDKVRPASNIKAWWKCDKGHSYNAVISSRTNGTGCPYCSNKTTLAGFNDLVTTNPNVAEEWHYDKNSLRPEEVCEGSHKKVWWKCKKCGHEWQTQVKSRTRKDGKATGCPKCALVERSLALSTPIKGINDLASQRPDILNEWNYEKNKSIDPSQIHEKTHRKVWWKCVFCGKDYLAAVDSKINRNPGCPYCSRKRVGDINATPITGVNDLKTVCPELLKEWDYERNQKLPETYLAKSNKKVYWKCQYGHSWLASIVNRVKGRGCPVCKREFKISFPEKAIFYYIRKNFGDAIENYRNSNLNGKEIDIYIPSIKIGIEYDGRNWHRNSEKNDLLKDRLCHSLGIKLLRVRENGLPILKGSTSIIFETIPDDNHTNLQGVISKILNYLNCSCTNVDITRDNSEILELMHLARKKNSILNSMPEISSMWDYEKNGNLTPEMFSKGSEKYVWVKCTDCGKSYRSKITNIYHKKTTKCLECSHSKLKKGVNDFKTQYPKLAAEYDYEKNPVKLEDLRLDERRNDFYWKCSKCGYGWKTSIASRIISSYCPKCASAVGAKTRKLNIIKNRGSLATNHPELAAEWHPVKNNTLKPNEITCGNKKIVWWKCSKCGQEWRASIALRTKGYGKCPHCTKK